LPDEKKSRRKSALNALNQTVRRAVKNQQLREPNRKKYVQRKSLIRWMQRLVREQKSARGIRERFCFNPFPE